MANSKHTYYAEVAPDGTVLRVIVSDPNFIAKLGGNWVQTWMPDKTARTRKNYAGPGMKFDVVRDAFIAPKTSEDATFDEEKAQWVTPAKESPSGR